jgi:hypothetical protein
MTFLAARYLAKLLLLGCVGLAPMPAAAQSIGRLGQMDPCGGSICSAGPGPTISLFGGAARFSPPPGIRIERRIVDPGANEVTLVYNLDRWPGQVCVLLLLVARNQATLPTRSRMNGSYRDSSLSLIDLDFDGLQAIGYRRVIASSTVFHASSAVVFRRRGTIYSMTKRCTGATIAAAEEAARLFSIDFSPDRVG